MVVRPKLECILLEKYTVAPAPSRDYYGIKVSPSKVFLYHWKISRFQNSMPTVQKIEMGRFMNNPSLHTEIEYIFGKEILLNIFMAAKGKSDCLSVLPTSILIHIISFLDLRDIPAVASTCKRFSNMVKTNDDLWMKLYNRHFHKKELTKEEKNEIRFWGWRRFYRKNLFSLEGKTSQLNTFSLFQGNKTGKPPHHIIVKKKKDFVHTVKSNATPLDVSQTKERHKIINRFTTDKKPSPNCNKAVVAATSKLISSSPRIQSRPKTTNSATFSRNKTRNVVSPRDGIESQVDTSFKYMPLTSSVKNHDTAKLSQPMKSSTSRKFVNSPKINKNK